MKAFPHLFAKLFRSPLMLHAPVRESLEAGLLSHMNVGSVVYEDRDRSEQFAQDHIKPHAGPVGTPGRPIAEWIAYSQDANATRRQMRVDNVLKIYNNVGVVKISGVIDKKLTQFEMDCYGGCDLEDIDSALSILANEPKVDTVVIDFNTPGGSVTGTPETAARVASLRKTKEVHAFVSTMCCSAGYYIASGADHIAAAPSSTVGSIGVYMAILDQTRALDMEGLKVELIKAGRLKAMGASFKELTDEEREFMQAECDDIWKDFKKACTSIRAIAAEDMEGQWFDGKDAKKKKLVDQLTNASLDEYVEDLMLR